MPSDQGISTFEGATAVVTGGASRIGRALGEAMARRGCTVLLGDLQKELADAVVAGIRAAGVKAEELS